MTTPSDLVKQAESLGAAFELSADGVRVKAPRPLPADLMTELKEKKPEIIEYLRARGAGPSSVPDQPPPAQPQAPAADPEADSRRREFERLRQEAAGETGLGAPSVVPAAAAPNAAPSADVPPPVEAVDVGSYHQAFQQLAAEKGGAADNSNDTDDQTLDSPAATTQPTETPPQLNAPSPGPLTPIPQPPAPDDSDRRAAFDKLRQEAAAAESTSAPPETPSAPSEDESRAAAFQQLKEQALAGEPDDAPSPQQTAASEDDSHNAAFDRLKEQAKLGESGVAQPPTPPPSPGEDSRLAAFAQLRDEAMAGETGDAPRRKLLPKMRAGGPRSRSSNRKPMRQTRWRKR